VALHCDDEETRSAYRENVTRYYPWLYQDWNKTAMQIGWVSVVSSREGGVEQFATWCEGLLEQPLADEIYPNLRKMLEEVRKDQPLGQRAALSRVIDKINARI
jgi:hypothetical protein